MKIHFRGKKSVLIWLQLISLRLRASWAKVHGTEKLLKRQIRLFFLWDKINKKYLIKSKSHITKTLWPNVRIIIICFGMNTKLQGRVFQVWYKYTKIIKNSLLLCQHDILMKGEKKHQNMQTNTWAKSESAILLQQKIVSRAGMCNHPTTPVSINHFPCHFIF